MIATIPSSPSAQTQICPRPQLRKELQAEAEAIKSEIAKDMAARKQTKQTSPLSISLPVSKKDGNNTFDSWKIADEEWPLIDFPWGVFPSELSDSFFALAESLAISPNALPGHVFALIAGTMGRLLEVQVTESWREPLIFWHGDIKNSGEGKTPAIQALMEPIEAANQDEYKRWKVKSDLVKTKNATEKQEREGPIPQRPFFLSAYTLEGLRNHLKNSPVKGFPVILDELSSIITSQGQYKGGTGDDRETLLKLWNGRPISVAHAKELITVGTNAVSFTGGLQPIVFRHCFEPSKNLPSKNLAADDGTLYRFLLVCDAPEYRSIDLSKTWPDKHRRLWNRIIEELIVITKKVTDETVPFTFVFDEFARKRFETEINRRREITEFLPESLRGFLPKMNSYVPRIAGILDMIGFIFHYKSPQSQTKLGEERVEQAITVTNFYLAHTIKALKLLVGSAAPEWTPLEKTVIEAIEFLSPRAEHGVLSIDLVQKEVAGKLSESVTPKKISITIRKLGYNIQDERVMVNGRKVTVFSCGENNFIKKPPIISI